ncbi:hypothetical protein ACWGCW_10095 [Streptomyces sp. NPDC054933]
MNFWIQTGNPALLDVDETADNMADAITLVYPADTEFMILSWNLIPVAVNYCEDIQVFVDDIVMLLEKIQTPDFTEAHVCTGASSFFSEWWIRRDGNDLVIDSRWDSVLGNYEFMLNERSKLTVETTVFTGEWLKVLRQLVDDLTKKSVQMENEDTFRRAQSLLAGSGERDEA